MIKRPVASTIEDAKQLLKMSHIEALALSLQDDGRWSNNYQMAMIIKNQKINERLVMATWILVLSTVILSGLTLYFQYIK